MTSKEVSYDETVVIRFSEALKAEKEFRKFFKMQNMTVINSR